MALTETTEQLIALARKWVRDPCVDQHEVDTDLVEALCARLELAVITEHRRKSLKLWRDHAERVSMGLCEVSDKAPGWALHEMAVLSAELTACCTMVELVAGEHQDR